MISKVQRLAENICSWFYDPVVDFEPDIVWVNDFDTLEVGLMLKEELGAFVVADLHELQSDRPFRNEDGSVEYIKSKESEILPRLDRVVTVSNGIAAWYRDTYGLSDLPHVLYNSPTLNPTSEYPNGGLRDCLGLPSEVFLCVYTGNLIANRGLDRLIGAVASCDENVHLALVGPQNNKKSLHLIETLIASLGVESRVHLVPPLPYDEVCNFVRDADLGIIPAVALTLNQKFGAPNKLFELTFAGLPILAVDIPERRAIIDEIGLGYYVSTNSVFELSRAIAQARKEAKKIDVIEHNSKAKDYVWGQQVRVFKETLTG